MSAAEGATVSNLPVVQAWFEANKAGDVEGLTARMSPDIEWTVVGHTVPIARTYRGVDSFLGDLVGTLMTMFVPGSVSIEVVGMWEDVDQSTVITQFHETATGQAGGNSFDNQIVTIMTLEDGKIVRSLEFMDLYEFKLSTEG